MLWEIMIAMTLFWKMMITAACLLVVGWIAYGIWELRERKIEKQQGKQRSVKLEKADDSMSDFEKQMADFQKKTYTKDELDG